MPKSDKTERPSTSRSIWLQPERTGRSTQPGLERERIVSAAIALADAEGFEAVTMRRVAADLGVGTMSLYWHVPNKENLLELMRDSLMGEVQMPDPPSGDWRADLRAIAHQTRATMKRHPWMQFLFASLPSIGPNMMRHFDLSLAALDGLDLDLQTMLAIIGVVDDFTMGFTLGEINQSFAGGRAGRSPEELRQEWLETIMPVTTAMIATGRYPRIARIDPNAFTELNPEHHFTFGLDCILDGIAAKIASMSARQTEQPTEERV